MRFCRRTAQIATRASLAGQRRRNHDRADRGFDFQRTLAVTTAYDSDNR